MARTAAQITNDEVLRLWEIEWLTNNTSMFKDNTWSIDWAALGAAWTVLTSNWTTSAPTFQAGASWDMLSSTYDPAWVSEQLVWLTASQALTTKTITDSSNVLWGVTMTIWSDADWDVYYRNSWVLTRLAKWSDDEVLTLASWVPSWAAASWWISMYDATAWTWWDYPTVSAAAAAWKEYVLQISDITESADIDVPWSIYIYIKEWCTLTMWSYSFLWSASATLNIAWEWDITFANDLLYKVTASWSGTVNHNWVNITNSTNSGSFATTDYATMFWGNFTYTAPNRANCWLLLGTSSVVSNLKVVWWWSSCTNALTITWWIVHWLDVSWTFSTSTEGIIIQNNANLTNVTNRTAFVEYKVTRSIFTWLQVQAWTCKIEVNDDCYIANCDASTLILFSVADFSQFVNITITNAVTLSSWWNNCEFVNCKFLAWMTVASDDNAIANCRFWPESWGGASTLTLTWDNNVVTAAQVDAVLVDSWTWNMGSYNIYWAAELYYFGENDFTWATLTWDLVWNAATATNLTWTPALPNWTTATTQSASDNSTKLATTAYVDSAAWWWPLYWDWVVFAGAIEWFPTNISMWDFNNLPAVFYSNGLDNGRCSWSFQVPDWKTSISSIIVKYGNLKNANDLYLKFLSTKYTPWSAETTDTSDTYSTYTSPTTIWELATVTVPSWAYDWLWSVAAWDMIWIRMDRDSTDANDTYETTFYVLWVEVTFA
jgi:hypothetical protein